MVHSLIRSFQRVDYLRWSPARKGMLSLRVLRARDLDRRERHRCDWPVSCIFVGFQFHAVPPFYGVDLGVTVATASGGPYQAALSGVNVTATRPPNQSKSYVRAWPLFFSRVLQRFTGAFKTLHSTYMAQRESC